MRLSMVFELLLIFLLVAFAAYARVIDRNEVNLHRIIRAASTLVKQSNVGVSTISLKQATDNVNKYCTCNNDICNCCRDFNIPVVQLKGPGCASVQYLKGDNMALQLSFGDNILTSTVVNGKSPKPVCVPLPGGFSKFCGRIYSIQREADDHFKACLGLELESSSQVEASLRVSCFRFGPDGLKLRPAEPLPIVESDSNSEDDDDDDDIFGLGSDDDDDDDDEDDDDDDDDDRPSGNRIPSSSADDDEDDEEDDDDDDVLGLGSLFDIFGDDDTPSKKPKVTTPPPAIISIPLITKPISELPAAPIESVPSGNEVPVTNDEVEPLKPEVAETPASNPVEDVTEKVDADPVSQDTTTLAASEDVVPLGSVIENNSVQPAASSVEEEFVARPEQAVVKPTILVNKIKPTSLKPTVTSGSINAIQTDSKKPAGKPDPVKNEIEASDEEEGEEDEDILGTDVLVDDEEEEDEDEEEEDDDEKEDTVDDDEEEETEIEENEENNETNETNKVENNVVKKPASEEKPESNESDEEESIVDDDDDDDDEEEDALITELTSDDKDDEKKVDKISTNEAEDHEEDDADYGFGLAEMLARKKSQRHMRRGSGRQSRVMRL